jgi:hypothetical protein
MESSREQTLNEANWSDVVTERRQILVWKTGKNIPNTHHKKLV